MGLWSSMVELWEEVSHEVDFPKLARGSVLRVELNHAKILNFDHFGIYAGNNEVIHFSEKKIRKESLKKFIKDASWLNGNHVDVMTFSSEVTDQISLEESYQRAKSCIGMVGYDLLEANCEHFALWCRTGDSFSGQAFGSRSTLFNEASGALVNIPRFIGAMYNELSMQKGRSICIDNIVDI